MENPAAVSQVPQKLRKDYDRLWSRFIAGADDAKLVKDLGKLSQKEKALDAAWTIEAYLALYHGDDASARSKFTQALSANPNNRIALYYLAELAYAHNEYSRAATLYAQLLSVGAGDPEIETKRQKAFLLATGNLLSAADRAERENRVTEAEDYYRQALKIAPNEPTIHARLAELLANQGRKEEAEAERKIAEGLAVRRTVNVRGPDDAKRGDLEDLGRWGGEIELFYSIRSAESVTREQLAILLIRYFPQVTEFQQQPQIVTDIQDSRGRTEIQTAIGLGLISPRPNRRFEPEAPVSRGDLAGALARLSRLIGLSPVNSPSIAATDVAPTNAMYPEIQLVLGSGLMTLEDSGSFDISGPVSGRQAVRSADRLLHTFQQGAR
jgi:Flp pilus assembly protein TadD